MFRKFKNSIVGKIVFGYAAIIFLVLITTLVSLYITSQNRKIDSLLSEVYYPMILSLKEAEMLASESYDLTNSLNFNPNVREKAKLESIHTKIAAQKQNYLKIIDRLDDTAAIEEARSIVSNFDALLAGQVSMMETLATSESYSDSVVVQGSITSMDKITPAYTKLSDLITLATAHHNELLKNAKEQKEYSAEMLSYLYIGNTILLIIICIYATYFSINSITKPITGLSELITTLSKGKFVSVTLKKGRDEIGRMGEAIETMLTGLKAKVEFAENIGKGNYESNFELLGKDDTLGGALLQMRGNLKQAAEEDLKRSWASEGLAKFADILRSRNDNLDELCDNITNNLVKYLNANQGALFLINDNNSNDTFIELVACYAYDRKKYLNKRIELGEGLTGQCIIERETIYMSDIPDTYMQITSGLGDALPTNLLIVPLKIEDTVFGAVEIASFQTIEPHHINFVEKLGESIASTISSVKVNGHTKKLLEETQVQAEQMRAQEEEMRQNMEELSATQEEIHRAQKRSEEAVVEMKKKEAEALNAKETLETREQALVVTTAVSEIDTFGNLTYVNNRVCEISKYHREELIGKSYDTFCSTDMPGQLTKKLWQTIKNGDVFRGIIKKARGKEHYWVDVAIVPVKNEHGEIAKYIATEYFIQEENLARALYNRQAKEMELPVLQEETIA